MKLEAIQERIKKIETFTERMSHHSQILQYAVLPDTAEWYLLLEDFVKEVSKGGNTFHNAKCAELILAAKPGR